MNEPAAITATMTMLFSLSFLTALTGAMSPGPLLTYTIIQAAKVKKRGYLLGAWVILGHAVIEAAIVLALLGGFSLILQNAAVIRIIGVAGGCILAYFGLSLIRDVRRGTIPTDFLASGQGGTLAPAAELSAHDSGAAPDASLSLTSRKWLENPIIGGMLISMSNPYWWVWWITIGFAFMIEFKVSLMDWPHLLAFFLGHEAGDLVWYLAVSVFAYFGARKLNRRAYYGLLTCCGVFMTLFGLYLGLSPLFKTAGGLLNLASG